MGPSARGSLPCDLYPRSRPSRALALPTPSWLPESGRSAFPVAATLRAVPHRGAPGRNVYPLLHPRPPLASTTLALPSAAASRSPPSVHNSSPSACSRWLLLCSHPHPLVPASTLPPPTPAAQPAET